MDKKTCQKRKKNLDNEPAMKKKPKLAKSKSDQAEITQTCIAQWTEQELLAEEHNLNVNVAANIIKLFEDGNTIPFIARYRRNITNNMTPEELRAVKESYDEVIVLKKKMTNILNSLEKSNTLTEQLKTAITASRSMDQLEYVYAPYKPGSKGTLAERAKELGLEEPALALLYNKKQINLNDYVRNVKELEDTTAVQKGIIHIIASILATDPDILSSLRKSRKNMNFLVKTKKSTSKQNNDAKSSENNMYKFDNYMDFEMAVKFIKPHQILAINRGESLKILSVKIVVPQNFFNEFKRLSLNKWLRLGRNYQFREIIIQEAIQDSYTRLIEPLVKREIRSELKQKAERASCDVFSTNLKQLLLGSPLKGKSILGIDPGFSNGCKMSVISPMGVLLDKAVIYPHKTKNSNKEATVLKELLKKNNCEVIALGNGTACRETEEWLSNLIQAKTFHPFDVKFTIVREEGASIYSCGAEAKKEFPSLDPNIISAVSLARRVQDPLAELIKVEPKHLGIGMYQHDLKKKQLDEALNDVISECVSFVGVDLNTASQCLLRHVAGLSEKKAQQILDYRNKNGAFVSRKQLLEVSGIGQKVFMQSAGFLRVGPLNREEAARFYKNPKSTKLDCTNIHPESYDVALKIINKLSLKSSDIGETHFISTVKEEQPNLDLIKLSEEFDSNEETIKLILDALSKPLNHDFRCESSKGPVFKKGLISINDLNCNGVITGVVNNVTHFGSFVDIGVGVNGLIHTSKYNNFNLQIGDKVEVKVLKVETEKKRIALEALNVLSNQVIPC